MTDRSTAAPKTELTVDVENDPLVAMLLAQADAIASEPSAAVLELLG